MREKLKQRRPTPPVADTTAVLDDVALAEILLRLPSPATIARTAALVCPPAGAASPPPPPSSGGSAACTHPSFSASLSAEAVARTRASATPSPATGPRDPTFLPVATPPPGVAGAVGSCRDFSLGSLPSVDYWALADARDGLLLLCSSCRRSLSGYYLELPDRRDIPWHIAVCDPLSGRSLLLPQPDHGVHLGSYFLGAALLTGDEGDIFSFEVLVATRTTSLCLLLNLGTYEYRMPWLDDGARAGACVYWIVHDWEMEFEHILVLDTGTKKFSTMNLPSGTCEKFNRNVRVMRSEEDRDLRLVAMVRSSCTLHFWRRDRSRSTKGRWLKENVVKFVTVDGWLISLWKGMEVCVVVWLSG